VGQNHECRWPLTFLQHLHGVEVLLTPVQQLSRLLFSPFWTIGPHHHGDKEQIKLGTDQDFWLAIPKSEVPRIKAKYVLDTKAADPSAAA
jgi:hypothetical protein